jgi:hypothetical protein
VTGLWYTSHVEVIVEGKKPIGEITIESSEENVAKVGK